MSIQSKKRIRRDLLILFLILIPALGTLYLGRKFELQNSLEKSAGLQPEELLQDMVFTADDGLLQQVRPFQKDEGYVVFLPTELQGRAKIFFDTFATLRIEGNGDYQNGDTLTGIELEQGYDVMLLDVSGIARARTKLTFYQAEALPSFYLSTETNTTEEIDQDKSLKLKAYYMAIDTDGTVDAEGKCNMSTRGNSSFKSKMKPYNIKLKKEASLFGMAEGKKWALLNYYLSSTQHLRNKAFLDMARAIGLPYAVDTRFCNVFVDGQYRGMYLLAQKPDNGGGSVKIQDMQKEHEDAKAVYEEQGILQQTEDDGSVKNFLQSNVSAEDITGGYVMQISKYSVEKTRIISPRTLGIPSPSRIPKPCHRRKWTIFPLM